MKRTELERRTEILAKRLREGQARLVRAENVPNKKKSKPLGYKMQNTFEKNLAGVPGGSRVQAVSIMKMIEAVNTGTQTIKDAPGLMRSMRNCNTTSGSYNQTILRDQTGDVISYADGRRK